MQYILSFLLLGVFNTDGKAQSLQGAWQRVHHTEEQVLLFMDGYFTHTAFDKVNKRFLYTRGGPYALENGKLHVQVEFDTRDKEQIGKSVSYAAGLQNERLQINLSGSDEVFTKLDDGNSTLSGLWQITGRMQEGKLTQIHRSGTRKTIKILSGSRFQWAAIDTGTRQFMGTGGGHYTFDGGKYTEHIEFFSRDSSRVGQSLAFDGAVKDGDWHHSGLSSRGDPIYEVWSREKK